MNNVKGKIDMTPYELEMCKYAFETGFNIGECNSVPSILQQFALIQLAK
jgi:hypothetical protein